MKNFIKDQNNLGYIATSNIDGSPNIAPKALLGVGDDTLLYADLFMDRTAENIFENNKIAIAVINPLRCSGYQFKGEAKISTKGEAYEYALNKFQELDFEEPVHAVELKIEEIFFFSQSPESKIEAA